MTPHSTILPFHLLTSTQLFYISATVDAIDDEDGVNMDGDDYIVSSGGSILTNGLSAHLDEGSLLRVPRSTLPTPSEKTRGLFIERARRRLREELNALWGVSYNDPQASTGDCHGH